MLWYCTGMTAWKCASSVHSYPALKRKYSTYGNLDIKSSTKIQNVKNIILNKGLQSWEKSPEPTQFFFFPVLSSSSKNLLACCLSFLFSFFSWTHHRKQMQSHILQDFFMASATCILKCLISGFFFFLSSANNLSENYLTIDPKGIMMGHKAP